MTKKIVITGGPGAGKTAVLELVRRAACEHIHFAPEAAGVLFGGGFPRSGELEVRRAAQRAIFYVQRELEAAALVATPSVLLCDRATVDGGAYWPGPGELWSTVDTTLAQQLDRYDVVIHLRTPAAEAGYNHRNPLRIETALEAAAIDARIAACWAKHPRRYEVVATTDFFAKCERALEILRGELPPCCPHRLG